MAPQTPDELQPIRLEKTENRELLIQWSDSSVQTISFRKLRDNCRCAHCTEKRMEPAHESAAGEKKLSNILPVLSLQETIPLDIVAMSPVGNYAYNIQFSDGHSAGIFSYELLKSIE
ncbi:DUF971 domain-containing protein [Mariniblastus sp.]|jgi:DUF971 family protein|nr:DUF971 domain-containing protein [Mariniblastus sp.]MDB4381148.1 DUF971 domain-containing protein [Mariniblastus sp.]MDB4545312.1 DUF971 domain-containing protein [bacterium]MDC0294108.1 DUF971 domain-containing protein [Mariniblastus sp.]